MREDLELYHWDEHNSHRTVNSATCFLQVYRQHILQRIFVKLESLAALIVAAFTSITSFGLNNGHV